MDEPDPCEIIVPIEIRRDYFVQIQGIPYDLSQAEAARLARIIEAYARVPNPIGEEAL